MSQAKFLKNKLNTDFENIYLSQEVIDRIETGLEALLHQQGIKYDNKHDEKFFAIMEQFHDWLSVGLQGSPLFYKDIS